MYEEHNYQHFFIIIIFTAFASLMICSRRLKNFNIH